MKAKNIFLHLLIPTVIYLAMLFKQQGKYDEIHNEMRESIALEKQLTYNSLKLSVIKSCLADSIPLNWVEIDSSVIMYDKGALYIDSKGVKYFNQ